jgi:hypothetical protein
MDGNPLILFGIPLLIGATIFYFANKAFNPKPVKRYRDTGDIEVSSQYSFTLLGDYLETNIIHNKRTGEVEVENIMWDQTLR